VSPNSTVVISASRRTDLVAFYPDALLAKLETINPERIHTLVIWTKNPLNMFRHRNLNRKLQSLDQVFVHLTVTGLGGSRIEPGVPCPDEIMSTLDELIELTGNPDRIRWRFDPIFTWRDANGLQSNIDCFSELAPRFAGMNITNAITSFCALYPKVIDRFSRSDGLYPVEMNPGERIEPRRHLGLESRKFGIKLDWCCEPDKTSDGCINGVVLQKLHPHNRPAPIDKAKGQRPNCRCTRSWDIGWYSQSCGGQCVYCYGNPEQYSH